MKGVRRESGENEDDDEWMMGVSLLSDGLEGSTVKTAHIRAALSNPPPPPIRLSNGGTRGMLREGGRQGLRWWWLGQTDGSNLVRRPKPCSQSLLTQAHPCSHCYPRISSLRPTLGRWKRRRLTDCCVSLMYEAALRIDVLEMVNSRFHQTRQESGGVWTVRCIICLFVLFCFMELSRLDIAVQKAQSEKCGCVLSAWGRACFPYGDILNSLMSCLKWIQRKRVCMIYAHFGLRVLYHTLFGLF